MQYTPRWLDVGTIGLYLEKEELVIVERAMYRMLDYHIANKTTREKVRKIIGVIGTLLDNKTREEAIWYERNKSGQTG